MELVQQHTSGTTDPSSPSIKKKKKNNVMITLLGVLVLPEQLNRNFYEITERDVLVPH